MNARSRILLLGLLLAACSGPEAPEEARQVDVTMAPLAYRGFQTLAVGYSGDRQQADRSGFGEAVIDIEAPDAYKAPAASDLAATGGGSLPAAMLVRTGTVSLQVDSLAPAVERVERIAARLGGFVGSSQLRNDAGGPRSADLGVKVPAARFDELLATVRRLGRLESFASEVEDAGAEYVDMAARLRNAHRLEARVLAVLATRAGKVADLIAAERELAHVREDIERYEGRIRWLRAQTTFSTLTVVVHEPPVFAARPGDRGVVIEAASQAWRNFLFLVGFLIAASGVIVPLALLATGAWVARRRLGLDGDVTSLRLGAAKADAAGGAR